MAVRVKGKLKRPSKSNGPLIMIMKEHLPVVERLLADRDISYAFEELPLRPQAVGLRLERISDASVLELFEAIPSDAHALRLVGGLGPDD